MATVREVFQSVNVNEQPSPVDIGQSSNQETLTGTEVNDILSDSHSLLNSMKLMRRAGRSHGRGSLQWISHRSGSI